MAGRKKTGLVLVDFINLFDFRGAAKLARRALPAARNTARLKARLARKGVPCIYANDNFGNWTSEFSRLVAECQQRGGASGEIASLLAPQPGDFSILKPRHSAFYGTPLEFLLEELGVQSIILTGLAADNCVFATAQDAYVRKLSLWIPSDCVAAESRAYESDALDHFRRTMKARTVASSRG